MFFSTSTDMRMKYCDNAMLIPPFEGTLPPASLLASDDKEEDWLVVATDDNMLKIPAIVDDDGESPIPAIVDDDEGIDREDDDEGINRELDNEAPCVKVIFDDDDDDDDDNDDMVVTDKDGVDEEAGQPAKLASTNVLESSSSSPSSLLVVVVSSTQVKCSLDSALSLPSANDDEEGGPSALLMPPPPPSFSHTDNRSCFVFDDCTLSASDKVLSWQSASAACDPTVSPSFVFTPTKFLSSPPSS